MSYSVSQLKSDLAGRLHGTSLNKINGPDDLISRGARQLILDVDPMETRQTERVDATFYDGVFEHPAPVDLKGNKVIDVRPFNDRVLASQYGSQSYSRNFDKYKSTSPIMYTVNHNNGTKYLNFSDTAANPSVLLDGCDSLTETAVWTGSTQIQNLDIDDSLYTTASGALWFDVLGGGGASGFLMLFTESVADGTPFTATLTGALVTPVDLTSHEQRASIFVDIYLEDPTGLTSIEAQFGGSSSSYWKRTVTAGHAQPFHSGWNTLRFDWSEATEIGGPTPEAVTHIALTFNATASLYNVRVDNFRSQLPNYYEIVYYSKYLFSSAAGVRQETVTADTNTVNLDTESYDLLLDICEVLALQQMQDSGITNDLLNAQKQYARNLRRYKGGYKSEVSQAKQSYYRMR